MSRRNRYLDHDYGITHASPAGSRSYYLIRVPYLDGAVTKYKNRCIFYTKKNERASAFEKAKAERDKMLKTKLFQEYKRKKYLPIIKGKRGRTSDNPNLRLRKDDGYKSRRLLPIKNMHFHLSSTKRGKRYLVIVGQIGIPGNGGARETFSVKYLGMRGAIKACDAWLAYEQRRKKSSDYIIRKAANLLFEHMDEKGLEFEL